MQSSLAETFPISQHRSQSFLLKDRLHCLVDVVHDDRRLAQILVHDEVAVVVVEQHLALAAVGDVVAAGAVHTRAHQDGLAGLHANVVAFQRVHLDVVLWQICVSVPGRLRWGLWLR